MKKRERSYKMTRQIFKKSQKNFQKYKNIIIDMKTIDGLNSTLDKILKGSDNRLHMCFHSFTSKNQNPDLCPALA